MKIKHCENCQRVYQQADSGLMKVLCRRCKDDCEQAYFPMHRVVRQIEQQGLEITALDIEWMAEQAKIPPIFALMLFREGYFGENNGSIEDQERENCKRCKKPLQFGQKRYCDVCTKKISDQLRSAMQQIEAPPPPAPPAERDYKYGLDGRRHS